MRIAPGRHVFGLAAVGFGVIALIWPNPQNWPQLQSFGNLPHREILVYIAAAIEILGGIAIQWTRMARPGAFALGVLYLIFTILLVPYIAAKPGEFGRWGGGFEQLSLTSAALIVYASVRGRESKRTAGAARFGRIVFGTCAVAFAVDQAVYLTFTASLVPKWIPPGQMFWAIATTVAFVLAAIALIAGRSALPAARWLTVMLVGFWLLVWMPISLASPRKFENWSENLETLAIAGAAWIVADYLNRNRSEPTVEV